MDESYDKIFQELFEGNFWDYPRRFWRDFLPPDSPRIKSLILEVEKKLGPRAELRSDARYFLLINFVEMVLRPISAHPHPTILSNEMSQWEDLVRTDLETLVTAAMAADARQPAVAGDETPGISGHAIVDALSAKWRELKLNDLHVWGSGKSEE